MVIAARHSRAWVACRVRCAVARVVARAVGWVVGRVVTLAVAASAAAAAPAPPPDLDAPHPVQAPHYGDTLFNFYQDKTFAAITGLMASQQLGRVSPHDDEAEVLRGGMLLAYGLHREAQTLFARLIDASASAAVRDRAWYFVAKAQQQRGLVGEAEASLARIAQPLPGALEEERQLMLAQLLMARQDHAGAAAVLAALQANPKASPMAAVYARFNLGVALIKSGDADHGNALLDAIGQLPAADEELRGLRDRANIALGFAALQAHQPREARVALQRVRLNAPQSNKALLGFGWAAADLNDPQLALPPWQELAARPGGDTAVLEARIAVPYALGELGADAGALRGYNDALASFAEEDAALAASMAAVRAGTLVQALLAQNPSAGLATSNGIAALPPAPLLPHAAHLLPLLAGNAFQEAFNNLRDLQFLHANLQHWLASLGVFNDMLANRQQAFAQRLPAVRAQAGAADIAGLRQRRDALAAALTAAASTADATAFANPAERALLQRVQHSQATLDHLAAADAATLAAVNADDAAGRASTAIDSTAIDSTAINSTAVNSTAINSTALTGTAITNTATTSTATTSTATTGMAMTNTAATNTAATSTAATSTATTNAATASKATASKATTSMAATSMAATNMAATNMAIASAAERLRRASGALTWQLAQALPARAWDATKALRATATALAMAEHNDAALLQAQQDEPARHARFAARIAALAQRLNELTPQVSVLSQAQQAQLQDIAVAALQQQQERLTVYAAQARLAIAQIHDKARFARRDNDGGAAAR